MDWHVRGRQRGHEEYQAGRETSHTRHGALPGKESALFARFAAVSIFVLARGQAGSLDQGFWLEMASIQNRVDGS